MWRSFSEVKDGAGMTIEVTEKISHALLEEHNLCEDGYVTLVDDEDDGDVDDNVV